MSSNANNGSWAQRARKAASDKAENVPNRNPEQPALKRQPSKTINNVFVDEKKNKVDWSDSDVIGLLEGDSGHRLEQRNKQIAMGKQTVGYQRYISSVPRDQRKRNEPRHPMTPNAHQTCSKRSWDGQVKQWRRRLHLWDPEAPEVPENEDGAKLSLSTSQTGSFYEAGDAADSSPASPEAPEVSKSSVAAVPIRFPEIVVREVVVEPMQLGNGEHSLLGQWAANSNSCISMELQGDSCQPTHLGQGEGKAKKRNGDNDDDEGGEELLFIPYQFNYDD